MKLRLRKAHLLILGIVSLICSRAVFFLIDDPEGPNLLIVIGLAVILFTLLYMLYVSIIKFGDTVEK